MSNKTIQLRVVTVTKKTSSEVSTIRFTYEKSEKDPERVERKLSRTEGAEWEEVEFTVENEEQPTIQIANVVGNALLVGQPKLIVNNPDLFGMYKVGDVIEIIPMVPQPVQRVKEEKKETDLVELANSLVKQSN